MLGWSAVSIVNESIECYVFSLFFLCPGKCLFLSGLTEEQLNHMHDQSLPDKYGIGFTNMVERTTPGSKDLSRFLAHQHGYCKNAQFDVSSTTQYVYIFYCVAKFVSTAKSSAKEVDNWWRSWKSTNPSLQRLMGNVRKWCRNCSILVFWQTQLYLFNCCNLFLEGIYEIFCKEIFGVKAKNLVFGLQPYKIPETETVSSSPRTAAFKY